jgi:hypothetical protein
MREPDLSRAVSIQQEAQGPESSGGRELMLHGPTVNEGRESYQYGSGAHDIVVLARMSPDAYLAHQIRMGGFYHRVDTTPELVATPRGTRELLLRSELPVAPLLTGPPHSTQAIITFGAGDVTAQPLVAGPVDGSFGVSQFGVGGFGG